MLKLTVMMKFVLLVGICLLVVFLVVEHFNHYPNSREDE